MTHYDVVLSWSHFRGMPQYPLGIAGVWRVVPPRPRRQKHVCVNGEIMTRWWTTGCFFLFLLMVQHPAPVSAQHRDREVCESQQTCASCLQVPRCAWCSMTVMNIYKHPLTSGFDLSLEQNPSAMGAHLRPYPFVCLNPARRSPSLVQRAEWFMTSISDLMPFWLFASNVTSAFSFCFSSSSSSDW